MYLEHILSTYNSKKTVNKEREHFSKEDIIITEMNIKIMKHHYIPNRMAKVKTDNTKYWYEDTKRLELKHCFGNAKWYNWQKAG